MPSTSKLEALLTKAMRAHQAGRLVEARTSYEKLLKAQPRCHPALHFLGLSYFQQGQADRGIDLIRRALALRPDYVEAHYNLAAALQAIGRVDEAIASYRQTLALDPDNAGAHNNIGTILFQQNRYDEAITHFESVLAIDPNSVAARANIAAALTKLGRHDDALVHCQAVLKHDPRDAAAQLNFGAALFGLNRFAEALSVYEHSLALGADAGTAQIGRGNALAKLGRRQEALAAFEMAIAAESSLPEAWIGRGNALMELNQPADAIVAFSRAVQLAPALAEGWLGRANALGVLNRYEEAASDYDEVMKKKPDLPYAQGDRVYNKLMICDWSEFDADRERFSAGVAQGAPVSTPFIMLSILSSPAEHLTGTCEYVQREFPAAVEHLASKQAYAHDKIRIGYLSANFQDHAIARLTAGVFEHHDRGRFSAVAFSLGTDIGSEMRRRLVKAFDDFVDVRENTDGEIADRIRAMEIDILIDLMGYTREGRPSVLMRRPAPVQVNYLGYPGTMGADHVDYIIADKILIPEEFQKFYSEKIVYLPNSYQANDRKRHISDETPSRPSASLPDEGFVFCCFNNSYKINPPVFDVWMNVLHGIEGSVLWLLESNTVTSRNLRIEAQRRGIAPERLVFAPRVTLETHLARHRLADLCLDTLPYNTHTTASDALWAGLPVLTCMGSAFAGRVTASLLHAIGLPELITASMEEYQNRAIMLARDKSSVAALKTKLAANRLRYPLFDTARMTRDLEAAYAEMYKRCHQGLPPTTFYVAQPMS